MRKPAGRFERPLNFYLHRWRSRAMSCSKRVFGPLWIPATVPGAIGLGNSRGGAAFRKRSRASGGDRHETKERPSV